MRTTGISKAHPSCFGAAAAGGNRAKIYINEIRNCYT